MRSRRSLTRQTVLASGVLLTAASCSFLYDFDQVQCEEVLDCAGFRDTADKDVACIEGVCEYVYLTTTSSGGSTGNPTSTSTTGSAGAGGTPECTENDDCIEKFGNPAICRDDACIELYTDECPIVLGAGDDYKNLKSPKAPFIFGAYSFMGEVVPEYTYIAANYEFAINEVNAATGEGYRVAGAQRPFVAVVCNMYGDVPASMAHLTKTLNVPAIVSTLDKEQLLDAFLDPDYGAQANNVFLMSTFDADSTLTSQSVDPNGLVWHMLGEAADRGVAYKPLVARTEAYIRAEQEIPTEEPIRVAMIVADIPYLQDMADVIIETVEFNGKSMLANEDDGHLQRFTIESINDHDPPDLGTTYNDVTMQQPHIVLAITTNEFATHLLGGWEGYWDSQTTTTPPFYLLSPLVQRVAMSQAAKDFDEAPTGLNPEFIPLRQRMLGVLTASATDTTLYDTYLSNFKSAYRHLWQDEGISLDGTENYYDAIYYTMFAMHGGIATTNLTGRNVAAGMTRLLGGDLEYDVGRSDAQKVIEFLRTTEANESALTVNGTMGPPDFNGAGARTSLPSVYCVDVDPAGTDNAMTYFADALRYDPATQTLSGDDPCSIDGFMAEAP